MDAREDFDQGALAGSVFADEGVHLAREEIEVHIGQRLDGAKSLGDASELQNRGRICRHRLPTSRTSRPRSRAAATAWAGARSSLMTRRSRSVGQNVAIATRFHLVWSKTPITSFALRTIAFFSSASSAFTSVRPSSKVKP